MTIRNNNSFFHYKHLKIYTHPQVYEPAEDTFFLLEAIDIEKNSCIFEIGTGTGIIALSCAQKGASVVCSDINRYAVKLAQKNITQNKNFLKGSIEVRMGSLFNVLSSDEHFDIIIFNPPYLPIIDGRFDEGRWFDIAVDGGQTGLEITKIFLKDVSRYLKPKGKGYFIFSTQSNRALLTRYLDSSHLHPQVVSSLSFENETLDIYKITK